MKLIKNFAFKRKACKCIFFFFIKKIRSSKSGLQVQKENIDSFLALMLSDKHSHLNQVHNKENQLPRLKDKVHSDSFLENCYTETHALFFEEESRLNEMISTPTLRHHFIERVILRTRDIGDCPILPKKWDILMKCTSLLLDGKSFSSLYSK